MLTTLNNIDFESMLSTYLIPWGINISMALAIFIVGKLFTSIIVRISKTLMKRAKVDILLINFVVSIVRSVLLLFVVIAALDQLGVNTTSLVALIGAAGLAIGLALQGSLQNFASGVMLIMFRPFTAGDTVETAGILGTVEVIGIFTTTMRTGDNREIIVPNGTIFGNNITNYSKRETRRIDMVFGIGYDDDLRKAKDIIKSILDADSRIHAEPAPLIAVAELAESSVNINVRPWCNTGDYWAVYFDMQEKIKLAFDENGISIPYPQMDIHQHSAA
jgi:small conductance mechanosensitive channel